MRTGYTCVSFLTLICGVSAFNKMTELFLAKSVEIKSWAEEYLAYTGQVASPSPDYPYWNFMPDYKVSVIPGGAPQTWTSTCFKSNKATVTKDGNNLNIKITSSGHLVEGSCSDNYILLTTCVVNTWASVEYKGVKPTPTVETEFTLVIPDDASEAELWDISYKGVRISSFMNDRLTTVSNILATAVLFGAEATLGVSDTVAKANIDFLTKYSPSISDIQPRDDSLNVPPPESEVHSGDTFYVMRLDGLNPMLAWAMGSTTGHVTTAIWIDGQLYVCESTTDSAYWPTDYVQRTPYQQWLTQTNAADMQVVWAPLSEEARAKYNETAAVEFFKSVEGLDYGYMTLLWGWLDTPKDNFPCIPPTYTNCLQWEYLEPLLAYVDRLIPSAGDLILNPGYSMRLGVPFPGMRTAELYKEAHDQGMDAQDVITIPENDNWRYNMTKYDEPAVGHNMVCCVFVCNTWKAAGVFGELADSINCGELTNWDDYVLTIHADTYQQIVGTYTLKLNDFHTKDPYAHMAETCSSLPPNYEKSDTC